MKHMIIDIETLGLREELPQGLLPEVTHVGAVIFDPATGEITEEMEWFPVVGNGTMSWNTTAFWIDQIRKGAEPRWLDRRAGGALDELRYICTGILTAWNRNRCETIWGNDPEMDLSPIECWMRSVGVSLPWNYFQRQDLRTLRNSLGLRSHKHPGLHDALADAKAEAVFVADMLRKLKGVAA